MRKANKRGKEENDECNEKSNIQHQENTQECSKPKPTVRSQGFVLHGDARATLCVTYDLLILSTA